MTTPQDPLDLLLRAWPLPDQSAQALERTAAAVHERLETQGDETADTLLAPPLAETPEETQARPRDRHQHRQALKELAKLAEAERHESRIDDSGVFRIPAEIAELRTEPKPTPKPTPRAETPVAPVVPVAPVASAKFVAATPAAEQKRLSTVVVALSAAVAIGAAAASIAFMLRSTTPLVVRPETPVLSALPVASPAPVATSAPAATASVVPSETPPRLPVVATVSASRVVVAVPKPTASAVVVSTAPTALPEPEPPAPPRASGPAEVPEEVPSVPNRPSQATIQGALGVVLPTARACLGPDDPIVRATVVFASSGAVLTVTLSGGTAAMAAEGCIRAALMRAKVPRFGEPTFTTTVTVRGQ
jgi:hypothetical protein